MYTEEEIYEAAKSCRKTDCINCLLKPEAECTDIFLDTIIEQHDAECDGRSLNGLGLIKKVGKPIYCMATKENLKSKWIIAREVVVTNYDSVSDTFDVVVCDDSDGYSEEDYYFFDHEES